MNLYKKLIHPNSDTIAWCLMPNHFHFVIKTDDRCSTIKKQVGIFLDLDFQQSESTNCSIFRQKTKSKCLNDITIKPGSMYQLQDYFINCFHYIHQNPFAGKLITRLEDWEFSSFRYYAGLRNVSLCNKELAILHFEYNPESFIEKSYALIDKNLTDEFM
ncbi:MAG: hypothetical protein ACXWWC_15730 [Chitinophagaceae bacterium]